MTEAGVEAYLTINSTPKKHVLETVMKKTKAATTADSNQAADAKSEPTADSTNATSTEPSNQAVAPTVSNAEAKQISETLDNVIPPLAQAAATRKALDDALKAKIIEELGKPGANMTKIANELGISYGTVQSIKSKLAKPAPGARATRVVAPKVVAQPVQKPAVEDVEMMKLELDYLRRKVALLESRK